MSEPSVVAVLSRSAIMCPIGFVGLAATSPCPAPCWLLAGSLLACLACRERADAPASSPTVPSQVPRTQAIAVTFTSQAALERLRADSVFASARVGFAGTPSPQARALRVLLADPQRADLLQMLLSTSTPAGRLYALVGLALTDSVAFQRNVWLVANDQRVIPIVMGCIFSTEKVSSVARDLRTEFVEEFRADSTTVRLDRLMDSLEARPSRSKPPAS